MPDKMCDMFPERNQCRLVLKSLKDSCKADTLIVLCHNEVSPFDYSLDRYPALMCQQKDRLFHLSMFRL